MGNIDSKFRNLQKVLLCGIVLSTILRKPFRQQGILNKVKSQNTRHASPVTSLALLATSPLTSFYETHIGRGRRAGRRGNRGKDLRHP